MYAAAAAADDDSAATATTTALTAIGATEPSLSSSSHFDNRPTPLSRHELGCCVEPAATVSARALSDTIEEQRGEAAGQIAQPLFVLLLTRF